MNVVWQYNEENPHAKKHAFWALGRTGAICGTALVWFTPGKWKHDEEGLAARETCKRCTKISENL